ncbi:MAG TPA: SMC-Scp complex subunit ScpB [Caldimonas sp.]|nr:SMC-Scp complex subunit ScpB [Caldimonas sp.]
MTVPDMSEREISTPAIEDEAKLAETAVEGADPEKMERVDPVANEDVLVAGKDRPDEESDDDEEEEFDDDEDDGDDDSDDDDDEDDDESESDGESDEDESDEDDDDPDEDERAAADVEPLAASTEAPAEAVIVAPVPRTEIEVSDVVSPDHAQHLRLLEALIFAGAQALDEKELAERLPNDADVARLLADLGEAYASRGVNLVKVAGGYAFRTAPDLSEKLRIEKPVTRKLSRAAIETLAIIAYHQPVTRAEIEQVRGVGLSKGTLDLLFEQNWIRPMGRRRAPGKPVTWGTSDFFLEHFGLASLDDLPGQEEMKAAGLLDARAQPPIFRPEEPDLPLEPTEEEADEPLAADEQGH